MQLQQVLPAFGQDDDASAMASERDGADETLLAEVP